MCWSAQASFTGAAVVGAWSIATIPLIKSPRELPYAALPMGFAFHQALEGFTWLELDGHTERVLTTWGVHYWILFAWALLPTWVPLAVWLIERDRNRRRLLVPFVVMGVLLSAFMAWRTLRDGTEVSVVGHSLNYELPFEPSWILAFPYVTVTCIAPWISTWKYVRWFGIGNFFAMSIAAIIQAAAYSSVWCTLAAFLSALVFWHFWSTRDERGAAREPDPVAV